MIQYPEASDRSHDRTTNPVIYPAPCATSVTNTAAPVIGVVKTSQNRTAVPRGKDLATRIRMIK